MAGSGSPRHTATYGKGPAGGTGSAMSGSQDSSLLGPGPGKAGSRVRPDQTENPNRLTPGAKEAKGLKKTSGEDDE